MNQFDYPTTMGIVLAFFAIMCAVTMVRGRAIKQSLRLNLQIAALLLCAATVVFGAARLTR